MSIFDELGIDRYINAHDTRTIYGGSRMSDETLKVMREASESFVDFQQMQSILGKEIAKMTHNEGAYICNGASAGLLLAAAVCISEGDLFEYRKLPDIRNMKNEIIVMRCQRNAYDKAIEASGAHIVEIGDADETLCYELEGAINEHTAALFYFESSNYKKASMTLQKAVEIAHKYNVPVVVDAAAQLPPVDNLWKFTKIGADMVIFSGGKTLCGPQESGLILGNKKYLDACLQLGAPMHGICRSSKISREVMAGLYQAVKIFVNEDPDTYYSSLYSKCQGLKDVMDSTGIFSAYITEMGPVGQKYPRVFGKIIGDYSVDEINQRMLDKHIYIGVDNQEKAIYISPLNITGEETIIVQNALIDVAKSLTKRK